MSSSRRNYDDEDDYDRPSRRYDDYDDRPSRRDSREDDYDDDRPSRRGDSFYDDDRFSIRKRRGGCYACGCDEPPRVRTQISQAGWIVFAVMLAVCWPLFFIGLLMNEEVRECRDCGARL